MQEIKEKTTSIETKEKIFSAAAELFARDGFYKVSVREICEAASVTKPVLYYYFTDKETLLEELVKETYSKADELTEKYIKPDDNLETILRNIVKIYIDFLTHYPNLTRFSTFIQSSNVPKRILELKLIRYKTEMNKLFSIIKINQESGVISDKFKADILALNFIGTIIMYIVEYLIFQSSIKKLDKQLKDYVEFWIQTFIKRDISE